MQVNRNERVALESKGIGSFHIDCLFIVIARIDTRDKNMYKSCILSTEFNRPPNLARDQGIYSTRTGSSGEKVLRVCIAVGKIHIKIGRWRGGVIGVM